MLISAPCRNDDSCYAISFVEQNKKQTRKFIYNVTPRRIRPTIVAVEKQWVLHNLCVYL